MSEAIPSEIEHTASDEPLQSKAARPATIVGECLRGWRVTSKVLGVGGFARVHEAWGVRESGHPGKRAAVKVIDLREQSTWAQGKLRSEADNLRRAQGSDRIVGFLDEIRHGPFQVFVLEAWGQCDLLDHVLEHRGLGERRAHGVLVQLLEALAWLHELNICHGDVKPENLLCERINDVDVVKLGDFGSAMQLPPSGSADVDPIAQGTTLYSPPEVVLGKTYSCSADMWATGITTYVLISGNFPFGNTADALSSSPSFEGHSWTSPLAADFISQLLSKDPALRPTAREGQRQAWICRWRAPACGEGVACGAAPASLPPCAKPTPPTYPLSIAPTVLTLTQDEPSTPPAMSLSLDTSGSSSACPQMHTPSKRNVAAIENQTDRDLNRLSVPTKKRFRQGGAWETAAAALNQLNGRSL